MNEYLIVKSAIRYKYYIGKDMLRGKDEFYYKQIASGTGTERVKKSKNKLKLNKFLSTQQMKSRYFELFWI